MNYDLKQELAYISQDRNLLAKQLEKIQSEHEEKHASLLSLNVAQDEQNNRLEERIKQMTREYDIIVESLAATRESNANKIAKIKEEAIKTVANGKKAEIKNKELTSKLSINEAELLELREDVKRTHDKEQKLIYDLRNTNVKLKQDNKRILIKIEQIKNTENKIKDQLDTIFKENTNLKENISNLEHELSELRREKYNREIDGQNWSTQIVELKKLSLLQTNMEDFPNRLNEKEDKIKELRMFVRKTEELNIRLDTAKQRELSLNEAIKDNLDLISKLKKDRILFQQQYEEIVAKHTELQENFEIIRKERDNFKYLTNKMQKQVQFSNILETLNISNFRQMSDSNLKIAASIKDLIDELNKDNQQK